MAKRKLLKDQDRRKLVDIPIDEDSLIRHYSLSLADRLEIELRRRKLKRAVFFHERGEIRDRSFESQAFRASGLNLVVSAIVHWNTVYLDRAITQLRRSGRDIPDTLLKHISPLSWEHINLTGIYTWDAEHQMPNGFRSLRLPAGLRRVA